MASSAKPQPKKQTQKALRAERALVDIPHPGLQFSHKHHVFITRTKSGELWALNHLSVKARSAITPLFEFVPPSPPRKPKTTKKNPDPKPKPAKSLPQHARDVLGLIKAEWSTLPIFLDTRYIPKGGMPSANSANVIFDVVRELGLTAVPVTMLRFSPEFQKAIGQIIKTDGRGVMIRLTTSDFAKPELLPGYLAGLLKVLDVDASSVDLLIDLEYQKDAFTISTAATSALAKLPSIAAWRTVTLGAGCFPVSISKFKADEWIPIDRIDWTNWEEIVQNRIKSSSRIPSYGDYGIRCGGEPLNVPNRPDPNIRYSTIKQVLVRKGEKVDGKMKSICSSLVKMMEFSGKAFSKGDEAIAETAAKTGSPNNGQAGQWIQWCTNHHLELTASQIRSLP